MSTHLNRGQLGSLLRSGEFAWPPAAGIHTPLRTSEQDVAAAKRAPQTPQTASSAYRLAFADDEFLTSDDTRGVRFQLEYLKPEFRLRERGIRSTVVLFGGARIPEPGKAAWAARNDTQKTQSRDGVSNYYDEARRFAQYASLTSRGARTIRTMSW